MDPVIVMGAKEAAESARRRLTALPGRPAGVGFGAMATRPADLGIALAEFLDWDDGTDTRYELIDGRVVAMATPIPSAQRHDRTACAGSSATRTRPLPAGVYVEAGIVTPTRADTYLQADLAVSCRPLDQQDRDVAEPVLVVEVEIPGHRPARPRGQGRPLPGTALGPGDPPGGERGAPGSALAARRRPLERRGRDRRRRAQARELRARDPACGPLRRALSFAPGLARLGRGVKPELRHRIAPGAPRLRLRGSLRCAACAGLALTISVTAPARRDRTSRN